MMKSIFKFLNPTGEKFDLPTILLYAIAIIVLLIFFHFTDKLYSLDRFFSTLYEIG